MSWQPFTWNQVQPRLQPALERTAETSHEALRLIVAFFTPAAVVAGVLGFWRLSSDLGWTDAFFITSGLFSHWQVWFALAGGLPFAAAAIRRRLNDVVNEEHFE
jgi:hypothetical protein